MISRLSRSCNVDILKDFLQLLRGINKILIFKDFCEPPRILEENFSRHSQNSTPVMWIFGCYQNYFSEGFFLISLQSKFEDTLKDLSRIFLGFFKVLLPEYNEGFVKDISKSQHVHIFKLLQSPSSSIFQRFFWDIFSELKKISKHRILDSRILRRIC